MRIGSLTLKLYLFSIVAVLATVAMVVAMAFALQAQHRQTLIMASGHVVRSLWLDQRDQTATRAVPGRDTPFVGALVTFYDAGGRLLASTASPPLPRPSPSELAEMREKGFVDSGHGAMAHEVIDDDGRVVAIGVLKLGGVPPLSRLGQFLLALLVVLLAGALIFARRLARPLQHVADVAKHFGGGDLSARVGSRRTDEIGQVGRAFDTMADRVAGLMAAQQELMANVSHELRTPLSRIQVAVDLIMGGKSEGAKELIPDIAQDLAELERLLDDVMTVAKLDLSRSDGFASVVPLRLELLPIGALIAEAVSRFRSLHPTRELAVDVDPELPDVSADPVLLRRVVDNLLENARKFSECDATIRLSAHSTGTGVSIAVADEGIGIDEADVPKVFTPFFRSDKSRARSTGGVGLGLALARRVVEAHKGTIDITSKQGQGTTVTLALPTDMPAAQGPEHQPS